MILTGMPVKQHLSRIFIKNLNIQYSVLEVAVRSMHIPIQYNPDIITVGDLAHLQT